MIPPLMSSSVTSVWSDLSSRLFWPWSINGMALLASMAADIEKWLQIAVLAASFAYTCILIAKALGSQSRRKKK